jgi:alkylation response protein AidB-like acyl-CoA dehydrogenase
VELDFTTEQDELRDSMRAVLARESPVTLARAVVEDDSVRPTELWKTLTELGWTALTISGTDGGIGLGMVEAGILAEELGRVIAPGPLLSTVTQFVPAVRELATPTQRTRFLGSVATGELSGSLAIAERTGSFDPAHVTTTVALDGDHAVVNGEKRFVIEGDTVDEVVVVGRTPGTSGDEGVCAVVAPTAGAAATRVHAVDGSRRLVHLRYADARVDRDRLLGDDRSRAAAPGLRRAIEEATVALALETVGTAQTIFDVTLEYAKNRYQFGAPIGSFQAIKHKFADMIVALERARSTGYFAALTIDEDDPRRTTAVSVAKAAAGDCQRLVAKEGIQIHGGIGYTWEHDMHLLVKRMKCNEPLFGTSAAHRARIAAELAL